MIPPGTTATVKYVVFYRLSPTAVTQALASQAVLNSQLLPQDQLAAYDVSAATALIDILFPWQTSDASTTESSLVFNLQLLQDNTAYDFQVECNSKLGIYTSNIVTVDTSALRPSMEGIISSVTTTSIFLDWNASTDPEVFGYQVEISINSRDNGDQAFNAIASTMIYQVQLSLDTTSLNITCFDNVLVAGQACIYPFTKYLVSLRTLRSSGLNGAQDAFVVTTKEELPPSPPMLNVTAASQSELDFVVTLPSIRNGYFLSCSTMFTNIGSNATQVKQIPVTRSSSSTAISFNGLSPYTSFSVVVILTTHSGVISSMPLQVITAEAIPQQMAPPYIASASGGLFIVQWSVPSPLPGVILYYLLRDGAGAIVYTGSNTQVSLPSSTVLPLRICATTSAGTGLWSQGSAYDPNNDYSAATPTASPSSSGSSTTPIIAAVVAVSIVALIAGLVLKHRISHPRVPEVKLPPLLKAALESLQIGTYQSPRNIDGEHVHLLEQLGEGKFGYVLKALLDESEANNVPGYLVAVKMSKDEATEDQKMEMLLEAAVMAQFSHPNVVNIIGHSCDPETGVIMVVAQYCEHGCLLKYLGETDLDVLHSLFPHFIADIASGMSHIASRKFVHRDLAVSFLEVRAALLLLLPHFFFSFWYPRLSSNT